MERTSRRDARARVVGVLAEAGAVSRADLARRAALAPSTVSAVVSELHAAGLVVEPAEPVHPPERGAVGRPPVLIALHRRAGVVAGIDFGKRHVRLAISDLSHALLAERHRALDADLPAKEAIALAAALFADALEEAEVARDEVVGVGMGLPGPGAPPVGRARQLHDPPRLGRRARRGRRRRRRSASRSRSRTTPTSARSASGCGAPAAAPPTWPTSRPRPGIGAGFIVAGAPYVGAGGTAGELGHTVVDPGGPICRCGNRGCLETLRRRARDPRLAARRPRRRPHARRTPSPSPSAATRAASARSPTPGTAIGTAVATLCNLFNPHRVVVGGDLGAAGELLLEPLRESLRARRDPLRGGGRHGRPGRTGRSRGGVGRCCACVRKGRRGLHRLTLRYSAMNTSNSQIVASSAVTGGRGEHEAQAVHAGRWGRRPDRPHVHRRGLWQRRALDERRGRTRAPRRPTSKAKVGVILPDTASSKRWETNDRPFLGEAFDAAGVESDIQNAHGDKAKFARSPIRCSTAARTCC